MPISSDLRFFNEPEIDFIQRPGGMGWENLVHQFLMNNVKKEERVRHLRDSVDITVAEIAQRKYEI